ncbi:MAG: hypothetical protein Q9169_002018 [Polycauliona sp. 2 TL-2023]
MPPKRSRKGTTGPKKKRKIAEADKPDEEAAELKGSTSMNEGDGFQSQIFTILVGTQQQKFTAHASFLSQSPVLERMCHGHFQESRTFVIRLPDDDSKVIRAVIQYLYTGDFQDFGTVDLSGDTLTALFSLAELYGLRAIIDVAKRPIEFIAAAKEIYGYIPYSDIEFRCFFKDACAGLLLPKDMPQVLREQYDDQISEGGDMALDMVAALCRKYNAEITKVKARGDIRSARITHLVEENQELCNEKERYKEELEQLQKALKGSM